MTTCFDWLFYKDITSESWRDYTGTSLKEMREFMRDPYIRKTVQDILGRDLCTSVEIDFHISATRGRYDMKLSPVDEYYTIRSLYGHIIFDKDEAALVLMGVLVAGKVPDVYVENYRRALGLGR